MMIAIATFLIQMPLVSALWIPYLALVVVLWVPYLWYRQIVKRREARRRP